jgi:hypothetical protein
MKDTGTEIVQGRETDVDLVDLLSDLEEAKLKLILPVSREKDAGTKIVHGRETEVDLVDLLTDLGADLVLKDSNAETVDSTAEGGLVQAAGSRFYQARRGRRVLGQQHSPDKHDI